MNEGMNKVILFGNLGMDPEVRYTAGGTPVLNLRLATNESFLDRNREPQERTEWHNVVLWGPRAEALGKMLHKGDGVLIEGSLRTSSYEKDGSRRYRTEVIARDLRFAGRRAPQAGLPQPGLSAGLSPEEGKPDSGELADPPAAARAAKNGARGRASEAPALDELPF